jgi:hypothetical protein
MASINKTPYLGKRNGTTGDAVKFLGKVAAGSTRTIKRGALCYLNSSGDWVEVSAVADWINPLAMADEEQTSSDVARMISMFALHQDDVFEIEIAAARALAVGDSFILTASNAQKLTYSSTAFPVARQVKDGRYGLTGTTAENQSYAQVCFDKRVTAWGLLISGEGRHLAKGPYNATANVTLTVYQSGLTLTNLGAGDLTGHVLPAGAPAGTWYRAIAMAAQDVGFDPNAADAIYIEGAKQADGANATVDAIGDSVWVIADGNSDWLGATSITSAADQTGGLDIA